MIFRFHCEWLAVDRGGATGAAAPPGPVKPDTFKFVDGFAFFRLSCFDYCDLQLFALSYSMSIFRRHNSRQVLKIAF